MDVRKFHKNYENEVSRRMLKDALAHALAQNKRLEDELFQTKIDLEDLEENYDTLENERDGIQADAEEYYDNWKRSEDLVEAHVETIGHLDLQLMDALDQVDDLEHEVKNLKLEAKDLQKRVDDLREYI